MADNATHVTTAERDGMYGTFDVEDRLEEFNSANQKDEELKDIVIETSKHQQEKGESLKCREVKLSSQCSRSLGLLLAFISGIMMTTYSSMIKMLDRMDPMQVVVIRGVLQFSIMGSIALYKRLSFRGLEDRRMTIYLSLVAITGGLRILFVFTSFARLPLGDSTTILFSSPVIVMILSKFILKETCGMFRVVAAVTLLTGVILVSKPPFIFGAEEETSYDALGYGLVVSACVMSALGIVLTKLISSQVEKLIILFYLGLATTLCGTIGLVSLGQPSVPSLTDLAMAITIGLLGMVQQYVLVWAVQMILFGVMPTWSDLLGAGLVLGIVVTIPFENIITNKLCSASQKEETAHKTLEKGEINEK